MSLQVVRRGEEVWELTWVASLWDGAHTYEVIGRVVRSAVDGLYYAEVPQWQDIGYAWDRVDMKGRLIPAPLFRWLEQRHLGKLPAPETPRPS